MVSLDIGQYAIQVFFNGSWVYVLDDTPSWEPTWPAAKVYSSYQEAEAAAEVWRLKGKESNVRVVEYT